MVGLGTLCILHIRPTKVGTTNPAVHPLNVIIKYRVHKTSGLWSIFNKNARVPDVFTPHLFAVSLSPNAFFLVVILLDKTAF